MADFNCIRYLPRKSFNIYGWLLIILFVLFGIAVISISSSSSFDMTSFQCYGKTSSKAKDVALTNFINKNCFKEYKEKFLFLPMNVVLMLKFGIVLVFSIIYAYCVKGRVQQFDYLTVMNTSNHDTENQTMLSPQSTGQNPRDVRKCFSCISTFFIYIVHLFVSRIIPLLIFAVWVLYTLHIPYDFQCSWSEMKGKGTSISNDTRNFPSNVTIIDCTNPTGGDSKKLMNAVAIVDVVVVTLAIVELGYIAWLTFNDRNIMTDKEFCTVYLLRKRKRIRKLVNKIREKFDSDDQELFQVKDDFGGIDISSRKLEDIYVNVVIQEGNERTNAYPRKFQRHEIYQSHLEIPRNVTRLTNPADVFKPIPGRPSQSYPRTILVIGRPGIGKTMLTRKVMHLWKAKEDEFWREKIVVLLQFRKFNNKTVTLREMLGYGDGLLPENFETMFKSIWANPTKTILIFDGLDELVDNEALPTNTESVSNPNARMPVFSIFRMLVYGRLLSGVTVLVTSRPTAQLLPQLQRSFDFQRTVEILGFFEEQIKEYVFKFCNNVVTSDVIWSQIEQSAELRSLCYIPVNCYIVCLTLKESNENIPETITELYKRAVKVLLYKHHPEYKLHKQKPSDYLIIPFPKELEDDLKTIKKLAYKGIDEGHLIFERSSCDEFGKLGNSGFFHKLPDKERNFFCFLHLTLQEFLAALHVLDDMDNVETFLRTHIDEPKWHLVIQFVAGLVGDKISEVEMDDESDACNPEESKMQKIIADIQKRFGEWVSLLRSADNDNGKALLGIKCLYELQVIDVMKSVSIKFLAEGDGMLKLSFFTITPLDSKAFFEFLSNSKNLKRLEFHYSIIHGIYSNLQMENFFKGANNIVSFSWHEVIFNENVKYLSNALKGQFCKLAELHLRGDRMTDEAVKYLSAGLKNCELTKLSLASNHIGNEGVKYLCNAIKSRNCKLTELNFSYCSITSQGVKDLSDAVSTNYKITKLSLNYSKIGDQEVKCLINVCETSNSQLTQLSLVGNEITPVGVEHLTKALKSENCKLKELDLSTNGIKDASVGRLSEACRSENCKLNVLNLRGNQITNAGVEHLSEALKSENCKLTVLDLSNNQITDVGVEHLSKVLKSENCKLNELNVSSVFGEITDVDVEHLSEALRSENCKLNKLDLVVDKITVKGVEHLSEALESEHCKLTCLVLSYYRGGLEWAAYIRNVLKGKNCKVNIKQQMLLAY